MMFSIFLRLLLLGLILFSIVSLVLDRSFSARKWNGPITDHFDGEHFYNLGQTSKSQAYRQKDFWKWIFSRPPNMWVWRENTSQAKPHKRVEGKQLIVTMINHASLLIQTEGINILTDPIWANRASPFEWIGPGRYRNPGILFEDLPPIDAVIISHNHYDHMNIETLRRLEETFHPQFFTHLANKIYLENRGISNVNELDWWDTVSLIGSTTITAVPAQHFSSRTFTDRNRTLWGGFVIETSHGDLYFAGDTGYGPFVEDIKKRYTEFRLAMVPIGAFNPEFFMKPIHVSPKEALHIAREIGAQTMIPMHYATFKLADDKQDEPIEKLRAAITEMGSSSPSVIVLENGAGAEI